MKKVILCLASAVLLVSCAGSLNEEGQTSGSDSCQVQCDSTKCCSDSVNTISTNTIQADTVK